MCPIGCSNDCSCGSKTGISCIISRSHCGNKTGISCISSSQQRGGISGISCIISSCSCGNRFNASTMHSLHWLSSIGNFLRAFLRLTKQTTEITSAISTTAPTLTPIAIFLVFPVGSKITNDKIACVQTSPLPQEKSGEETSVNRRR